MVLYQHCLVVQIPLIVGEKTLVAAKKHIARRTHQNRCRSPLNYAVFKEGLISVYRLDEMVEPRFLLLTGTMKRMSLPA
eukprot:scaffold22335_cov54-Cylindrotheca_fusiformis.AAC.1